MLGFHLDALIDCNFQGNEVGLGNLDLEFFIIRVAVLVEVVVHEVGGGGLFIGGGNQGSTGQGASVSVKNSGGAHGSGGGGKVKGGSVLVAKEGGGAGLEPGLKTDELAMEEGIN